MVKIIVYLISLNLKLLRVNLFLNLNGQSSGVIPHFAGKPSRFVIPHLCSLRLRAPVKTSPNMKLHLSQNLIKNWYFIQQARRSDCQRLLPHVPPKSIIKYLTSSYSKLHQKLNFIIWLSPFVPLLPPAFFRIISFVSRKYTFFAFCF